MKSYKVLWQRLDDFSDSRQQTISKDRVLSVDALRGFDMFWIIGGRKIFQGLDGVLHNSATQWINAQLNHAEWFGFTFYDIIMPLFLFLVGISMVFSFRKRLSQEPSKKKLWKHIVVRFVWLWIFGMIVQGKLLTYDIDQIKLFSNTLQAIAAGYVIAALLILYLPLLYQIAATIGLMLMYWALLVWIPVPEISAGVYSPEGNVALLIDKSILQSFQDGTTYTWILSSLNFGATTMLGVFTGYLFQTQVNASKRVYWLMIAGIALIGCSQLWAPFHPIIKHIWTSSFVLYSGGICLVMVSIFYLAVDVLGYRKWTTPLVIIGSNAIAAYVSAHIFDFKLIAAVFVRGLEQYVGLWYPFVLSLGGFLILYSILKYMFDRKIILKI
jgi:predicted acyltransferase